MENKTLQVGFSRVNITPEESVPLAGYGNTSMRLSQSVRDETFATCAAITDADGITVLLYASDMVSTLASLFDGIRQDISEATGVPFDNIHFSASHMHSGADLSNVDFPSVVRYRAQLAGYMLAAAKEALADRKPARMYVTSTVTKGLNFVRRYKLQGDIYVGYQSDVTELGLPVIGYETEADASLQLVKFDRGADKNPVMIANFQTHPHKTGGMQKYDISADIVGEFRDNLSAALDCDVVYFTGASGDQNPMSRIATDHHNLGMKAYGEKLAEYAYNALDDLKPVEGNVIKTNRVAFTVNVDHTMDHMIDQAREVYNVWKSTSKAAGNALAEQYGIKGVYHARGIINRINQPETTNLELNTFRIGDLGFITGTMEMFPTPGKYARDNSPFENTFIITGCSGYIPCSAAYDYGSYEAVSSTYQQGTAEQLAEQYVKMLNEIK